MNVLRTLNEAQPNLTSSSAGFIMWVIAIICVASVMVSPSLGGIKDLDSHFSTPNPNRSQEVEARASDMEAIPLEFHKENTVTNDLIFDGFEDEDYIDFDKILEAGSDDYM